MNLNNYSKIENRFIKKGFIIEKVERNESIYYINNSIKKNLIKLLKLNIPVKKLDLNNLHKYLNQKSLNKVRLNLIHEINSDKNFRKNYFFLAKNMLNKIIGNELVMQKNINLSIQLPNDESSLLPIHSDTWSGDSPFESVLWIPLVNCFKTKSMFILDSKAINKFNKNFLSKKIKSVSDLYIHFKKNLKFIKIDYKNYLLFNQNLPHGNLVNSTSETRVSLNCRFKGLFTPYRQKELGSFFSPIQIRPATKIGLEYKAPGQK